MLSDRRLKMLVWLLHASTFIFFASMGLLIPILPGYLRDAFGVDTARIGLVIALMPLAGIVLRPWTGWLADGWSRKLPTVIGLLLSGVAGIAYFGGLPLVLVARLLQGVGLALYAPSSLAVTSDLVPDEQLAGVMSTRNLLVGVGLMAGSAAGGALAEVAGVQLVFLLVALLQLAFVPLLLTLPETVPKASAGARREPWWRGYAATIAIRPILAATVANVGFAGLYAAIQAYYPIIVADAGFTIALVGAFFGFYGLVSVLFRLPVGVLAERFGAQRVALWGFVLAAVGYLALWLLPLPPLAFAAAALLGAGSGFYLPANLVTVSQAAPKRIRGSAFSLYTLSWDLGGVIGPGLAGGLAGAAGTLAVLPAATVLALLVIIVYVSMVGGRVLRLPGSVAP